MSISGILSRRKQGLSAALSLRSVKRHHQYPSRSNTIHSLLFALAVSPLALGLALLLAIRRLWVAQLRVTILASEGEFGPTTNLLEYMRLPDKRGCADIIVVLNSRKHHTLHSLYSSALGTRVIWSNWPHVVLQQALLLQPKCLVKLERLTVGRNPFATQTIPLTKDFLRLRERILVELGLQDKKFVVVSLHTRAYDDWQNPQYAMKERVLESDGELLTCAVDYLQGCKREVVLLGAKDDGKSKIDREIARLSQFGRLGGPHEVVLASACEYFWSDNDGGWWLTAPFKRPVLWTNDARILRRRGTLPAQHLILPVRFQSADGEMISLRKILSTKSAPYKAVGRGELRIIKNTSQDLIGAHEEMIARCEGKWVDSNEALVAQERLSSLFAEYPERHSIRIPSDFLIRNADLLD